ncbi:hypothetical protein [Arenicella xantha]|uniref:Uncharacterized protein n=1 Tax=Arenicella xantha TaxID=644221 RepID=A0A395JJA1_9GAMM|nr:hypothetical protein [Arenicella xantha]RBP50802.1 hypothetical protein DFR28_102218 [Arenicella xantha]
MTKRLSILTAILLTLTSQASIAECIAPTNTPIIPDGHVASQDELIAAQNAVKAFQERNLSFLLCLDEQRAALTPEAEGNEEKMAAFKQAEDDAIELEKSVANEFNTARKAFMAR